MSIGLEQLAWRAPPCPEQAANNDTPPVELSAREVALIEIAADVVTGAFVSSFDARVQTATAPGGLTQDHIRELLRHLTPYAGLSVTAIAFERLVENDGALPAESEAAGESATGTGAAEYSAWALEGFQSVDPVFAGQLHRYTEDLWERPGLSKRERALVTLATDVVSNALGGLFSVHLALAQRNGVSLEEVAAIIRLLGERAPHHGIEAFEAVTAVTA